MSTLGPDSRFLALDIQTTGATPSTGNILEIGWAHCPPVSSIRLEELSVTSFLLKQTEPVPPYIEKLTGIGADDVQGGHCPVTVCRKLLDAFAETDALVIHYADFEIRFLESFLEDATSKMPPVVCTHEIAKQTHTNLPNRGLRALSGFFGRPPGDKKRVAPHVRSTVLIWRNLRPYLPEYVPAKRGRVVSVPDELSRAAGESLQRDGISRERRLGLPEKPGLYVFRDGRGNVLYVGKARDLKDRVNSYFQGTGSLSSEKKEMLTQVKSVDIRPQPTPLEATIREPDVIKNLSPPYNKQYRKKDRELGIIDIGPSGHGPFRCRVRDSSARWLEELNRLLSGQIEGFADDTLERMYGPLAEHLDRDELSTALADWLEFSWLPSGEFDLRTLDAIGQRRWTLYLLRQKYDPEGPDDQAAYPKAVRYLTSKLRRSARDVRLARWFALLANCRVSWRTTLDARRELTFEDGRFSAARSAKGGASGALPDKLRGAASIDTYDRLSALSRGIKQLAARGRAVTVSTPFGRLPPAQVEAVLRWL